MMLITTFVVSFWKDGGGSVSVKVSFLVVCVRCEVVCCLVVAGLKLIETRYQPQPSNKQLHTEHTTPLRIIILH